MPLLTIPSIAKGTSATIELNKTNLFTLAAVAADAYFSDPANVKLCIVRFDSDPGNQSRTLQFDLSQATPSASILLSARARSSFLLDRLTLVDYDGGTLVISRSQLPSGLDIAIAPTQDPSTVFLAHFDGNLNDSSASALTPIVIGTAPLSVTGKIGQGIKITGNQDYSSVNGGSKYLEFQTTNQCDFGTGDFTIEGYVKHDSAEVSGTIASLDDIDGARTFSLISHSGNAYFAVNGGYAVYTNDYPISTNLWWHLAVTRSDGVLRLFVNGVKKAETSFTAAVGAQNKKLQVGVRKAYLLGGGVWATVFSNGYFDEVRISKGVARYTANFTPPSAPLI